MEFTRLQRGQELKFLNHLLLVVGMLGFTSTGVAQTIDMDDALEITSGSPVLVQFDCAWGLGGGFTQVEIAFLLVRNEEVIDSSSTFICQSSGSDTWAIQFDDDVQIGDRIRMVARFTGPGKTPTYVEDEGTAVDDE